MKVTHLIFNFTACCLLMFEVSTQECRVIPVSKTKAPYPYWISTPENYNADTTADWPVIVFLHGRSLSGTDLNLVKKYGVLAEIEKGRRFPAIVLAPQVKTGESWNPDKVIACIEEIQRNFRVDTTCISITGMSLGGYGTLHTAGKYPDKFCAAAAFCGGGNAKDACNLASLPVWIAHGKKDEKVPFGESYEIAKRIEMCRGEQMVFTVFESANHGALERLFRSEELYSFLLGNKKGQTYFFPEINKSKLVK